MRISQISVEDLFGTFDHTILLNVDEHITIIHGPNGFGKTVLLNMIADLFKGNYETLYKIPFKKFEIKFDDGSYISLERYRRTRQYIQPSLFELPNDQDKLTPSPVIEISAKIYRYNYGEDNFLLPQGRDAHKFNRYARLYADRLGYERMGPSVWANPRTGESYSARDLAERYVVRYGGIPIESEELLIEPKIFRDMLDFVDIHFIETQRLLNTSSEEEDRRSSRMKPAVEQYARELAETIRKKLAESVALSQSLDRTFPVRLVELVARNEQPEISSNKLQEQLGNLEAKRLHLIEAGLLDKEEDVAFQVYRQTDESLRSVISVYIQDVAKKLAIFDDLADRIDLFKKIINSRFSHKKMITSKEHGFRFIAYNSTLLSTASLSSGEQHELILLYELLFKVKPDSLILIDEPEISLHIAWQQQFLEDLQEITGMSSFDVLIATHSPQLINDRWDLTVELKGRDK